MASDQGRTTALECICRSGADGQDLRRDTMPLPGPYLHPTLTRRYEEYQATRQRMRPNTVGHYIDTCRRLQLRCPELRFEQFTAEDIIRFLTVADDGARRTWQGNTTLHHRTGIVALFQFGVKQGLRLDDPSLLVIDAVAPRAVTHRPGIWLLPDQVRRVLGVCEDTAIGRRDRNLLTLALNTGLRRRELANLRWCDIDLGHRTLQVLNGKGGKDRIVGLPPSLVEALAAWRAEYGAAIGGIPLLHPLFPRHWNVVGDTVIQWERMRYGKLVGLGYQGIPAVVGERGRQAGIPGLATHDLRRSYAGGLEAKGVPIQDIGKLLGHNSVDTTIRYLADNPAKRAASVATDIW